MFRLHIFNTIKNSYYSIECEQVTLRDNINFLVINEEGVKRSVTFKTYNYCLIKYDKKTFIFRNQINLYVCNKTNYISIFITKK